MLSRILYISLAFNLFISTTGLSVFNHICKRKGVFTALFHTPDSCCSKKKKNTPGQLPLAASLDFQTPVLKKTPCCKDLYSFLKAEINSSKVEQTSQETGIQALPFNLPIIWQEGIKDQFFNLKILCFELYENPPPDEDILVSIQSFLC